MISRMIIGKAKARPEQVAWMAKALEAAGARGMEYKGAIANSDAMDLSTARPNLVPAALALSYVCNGSGAAFRCGVEE